MLKKRKKIEIKNGKFSPENWNQEKSKWKLQK